MISFCRCSDSESACWLFPSRWRRCRWIVEVCGSKVGPFCRRRGLLPSGPLQLTSILHHQHFLWRARWVRTVGWSILRESLVGKGEAKLRELFLDKGASAELEYVCSCTCARVCLCECYFRQEKHFSSRKREHSLATLLGTPLKGWIPYKDCSFSPFQFKSLHL